MNFKTKILATTIALLPVCAFAGTDGIGQTIPANTIMQNQSKTLAQWQIINKCNSFVIQTNPNGKPSEMGDSEQLYSLPIDEQRAAAREAVRNHPDITISVFKDTCQLHMTYREKF